MNSLNNREKWSTIDDIAFVIFRPEGRMRRVVGLAINAVGAGVLLSEVVRWLSV